jgi:flagellar FliL protein
MVQPNQPKGMKPKAEVKVEPEQAKPSFNLGGDIKPIIINAAITILVCMVFVITNFFIVKSSLNEAVSKISLNPEGGGEEESVEEEAERGLILDLGEFILNLSDPRARRYLKINVALELTRTEADPDPAKAAESGSKGGHGGGGGDPLKQIEAEMSQFKPAIRDAVISTLSSKTAEELSSVAGKELAKEQIKESVNAIFAGEREVMRVSFGNFIIQ